MVDIRRLFLRLFAAILAGLLFSAATLSADQIQIFTGTGADLNVATFNTDGSVAVGVTTLTIPVSGLPNVVAMGDSVILSLTGLEYPWVGDLQITLALEDSFNNVLASGDAVNRPGLVNPSDPNDAGYGTQYGDSFTIDSGNYVFCPPSGCPFNTGYNGSPAANDLWTTAALLGSIDSIPSGNYAPTTALTDAYDNLDMQFGGQTVPTNGKWVLTITDYYPPFPNGDVLFTPGIQSWGLTVVEAAPEPPTLLGIPLTLGLLWFIRRQKHSGELAAHTT